MKYTEKNTPIVCMMTNSTCYKGTKEFAPKGILWHSTGANNPWLSRYVQPTEGDKNYDELIKLLGKNKYSNDWNHKEVQAGLNAWIGKLADGTVATVQTMPWNYRPWGCGSGSKGSCNDGWIQFEIGEDALTDATYFNKVYKEACELTAYLCKKYNINPNGTVVHNGVTVPTILCHYDSYKLGLGSNHGDVLHWFNKHGKTMDDVRKDVNALLNPPVAAVTTIKKDDVVKIASNAVYTSGKSVPAWVKNKTWIVKEVSGSRVVIDKSQDGKNAICSAIDAKYLTVVGKTSQFKEYKVKVTVAALRIRAGAGITHKEVGMIRDKGVYTIIDEKKVLGVTWGLLKSKAGWICLTGYTKKV
jgi:hypothetical protein